MVDFISPEMMERLQRGVDMLDQGLQRGRGLPEEVARGLLHRMASGGEPPVSMYDEEFNRIRSGREIGGFAPFVPSAPPVPTRPVQFPASVSPMAQEPVSPMVSPGVDWGAVEGPGTGVPWAPLSVGPGVEFQPPAPTVDPGRAARVEQMMRELEEQQALEARLQALGR